MDSVRYGKLKGVFNEACEAPIHERAALIEAKCAGDPELQREVESMLAHIEVPAVDLESVARGIAIQWGEALRHEQGGRVPKGMPERIGPFTMVSVLGQGGMGVVYLARQDKPERQVALKLIRPDLTSSDVMRRFDRETRALGRLQHPGIAQIFEAGVAEVGGTQQPYIAMEFVRGRTLLKYAAEEALGTRDRLALMEQIARAVEHAHQQGVIHRDLKPANIVVDERGQPKVLDFGIARTTDDEVRTQTLRTGVGQLIGTLPYMSPEQVSGEPEAVDTRADVYALGVICFELLTDRLPVDVQDRSIPEAVRIITQTEPTRLGAVNRVLRGDLDTIVGKALEHEKSKRYASAGAMADDIRRYLDDEPILARPASAMYQLRKLARRNKALVIGTAAVLLVLVAGLIASSWGWMSAVQAQHRAETQATRATQVSRFMQDILSGVDPDVAVTMDTQLLKRLLDEAAARIETSLQGQPEVEAEVREAIGRTFHNAGDDPKAEPHLRRAAELYEETIGRRTMATAVAKGTLGGVLMDMGRFEEAEPLLLDALDVERELAGPEAEETFLAMNNLGDLYMGMRRFDEAEAMLSGALEIARKNDAVSEHIELVLMNNLGAVWIEQGRIDEARVLREDVYARRMKLDGPDDPSTNVALNNLAFFYDNHGPEEKVIPMYQQAYAWSKSYYGERHPRTMVPMNNVASATMRAGQIEEAAPLFDELVSMVEAGQGSPLFAAAVHKNAAMVHLKLGHAERAEGLARRCLEIAEGFETDHPILRVALMTLGQVLTERAQYEEAEAMLLRAQGLIEAHVPAESAARGSAMPSLIELYERWGKAAEAVFWRERQASAAEALEGSGG